MEKLPDKTRKSSSEVRFGLIALGRSDRVLGRLYDAIENVGFKPILGEIECICDW
jgi:hypothetical protein